MLSISRAIFFLSFVLCYSTGFSQFEKFTRYTTKDGLLSDEVYNLHQDKDGYIWLFTNYGALKYNSVEFKPVLRNLPFSESFIYSIYENKDGRKWVANSNAKIYEIVNDSAFQVKGTDSTSKVLRKDISEIYQLHVDDSLNIYASTKRGAYKFQYRNNNYFTIDLSKLIKYDSIAYQVTENNGKYIPVFNFQGKETGILFGSYGRLGILLDEKEKQTFYEVKDRDAPVAPKLFKRKGKKVYFCFFDRLGVMSEGKPITYIKFKSLIPNFTFDKKGHIWVGCFNNGIFELDERDSIINHYLGTTTINDILIDSQNGLWASSPGMGLFHYKNLNNFRFMPGEPLADAISFIKKIDDELFIANSQGDLFRIKKGKTETMYLHNNMLDAFDRSEKALDIKKMDSKYMVSFMYRIKDINLNLDAKNNVISTATVANAQKIVAKFGDTIIYMHRRGIGSMVNGAMNKRVDLNSKTNDCIYINGSFLIATDNGICTYPGKLPPLLESSRGLIPIVKDSLRHSTIFEATKGINVKKIIKDYDKNLWFPTIGEGLFILSPSNELKHISVSEGLPSNIINDLSFSKDTVILLSTNKGLYISNSDYNKDKKLQWRRIYTGEVNHAVLFEDKIYLGTTSGLIIMNYSSIYEAEGISFNLNSIYINSLEHDKNSLANLKYNQNNIEFKFDVIHFSDDRSGIRYFLSGPVIDSGIVTGNSIKIQNLPYGNYVLRAIPEISKSNQVQLTIPFSISPAFWQTTYFLIFFIIFIILLTVFIVWLIIRNIKRNRDKKEQAEKLILEYKLIALKAQINPHFVSNCLSAIQLLIINNKVDAATQYIAKFGLLVRQILNFSTRSLVSVSEELEITTLNMDLEQLRFENKFQYEVSLDEKVETREVFVPALILNPIIENAVWHGLLPLKSVRQGKLLIKIQLNLNMLILTIEDNGVGRGAKKPNLSNSRQSKGIQLTEQRLNNINYLYAIETAKMVYTDLFDDNSNPSGTRVAISLPLNLKPLQYE